MTRHQTPAQRERRLQQQRLYNQRRRRRNEPLGAGAGPRESDEQRDQRLARQREYNRQRRRSSTVDSVAIEQRSDGQAAEDVPASQDEVSAAQSRVNVRDAGCNPLEQRDQVQGAGNSAMPQSDSSLREVSRTQSQGAAFNRVTPRGRSVTPETTEQRQRRLERQREYNRAYRGSSNAVPAEVPSGSEKTTSQRSHRLDQQHNDDCQRAQLHSPSANAVGSVLGSEDSVVVGRDLVCAVSHSGTLTSETADQRRRRLDHQRAYNRAYRRSSDVVVPEDIPSRPPETVAQRSHRLDHQRDYDRQRTQRRSSPNDRDLFNDANVEVTSEDLTPPTSDCIQAIEENLTAALGAEGLDECVCAVCDRLVLRKSSTIIRCVRGNGLVEMMRTALSSARHSLPSAIVSQYDCSSIDSKLDGMLLSRNGVRTSCGQTLLNICNECHSSLMKQNDKPPKFAIANGFFIGRLPDHLFEATWIEKVMTQLVTVVAQTRVMRGGRHRAIRSHCLVFDATPGPPATLLPRRIDQEGMYRVVLAGPLTSEQTDTIRKLHRVRGSKVRELLAFFKENNQLFENVEVSQARIQALEDNPSAFDDIMIEVEDSTASSAVDRDQESVVINQTDNIHVEGEDQCALIERNIILASNAVPANAEYAQRVVDLNPHETHATPRLRVNHSSRFAATRDIEAMMFPHLFPFGRGHPHERREVYVSKIDCIRHYAMLSSRRFSQDPTFLLTMFERLSLENMYTMTSVKCRRNPSLFQGYELLTQDDIAAALLNNERRQRGESSQAPPNPDAARFLNSVELGSVSVWGSSAERRQCRQEAFGFQTRFGQPSLFVTLTPNTDNSYAMAHYTGILSVDTLFDVLEARIPSQVEMRKAAMMDDCASARLFMRTVDAFINHVLGVDSTTMESKKGGGVFGRTKAYYGMVETQGRGSLHIHFLVWLHGSPVNTDEFERRVRQDGDAYVHRLAAFVDSIVTTQLPLTTDQVQCSRCQTQGSFAPLKIPTNARRENATNKHKLQVEPLLLRCEACDEECSAQHILRQALLMSRPPHWPPPLSPLSNDDRRSRIQREAPTRASMEEAEAILDNREMVFASLCRDEDDSNADWYLHVSDSPQLPYIHMDDDPFKLDTMNRLIEMTPPTLDKSRMSPEHFAYMISCLVFNFNMHLWTHTSSCFKKSRATSSESLCRYGFPRERRETSDLRGLSVSIRRSLAHEYINGYNPTIMAAFKCNHDIQVLFGGKDAINRIYYCCKYVTKCQRPIDSMTAVALASFQRRQAKEAMEAASDAPPTLEDARRRRVTSMVYTFTNKQEIAGPLAAFYILRGSCCYSSASCVKLPLGEVLTQLEGSGEYLCTLVRSQTLHLPLYRSASYLDDYIYRPESASGLSLYEFGMRCYRRRIQGSVSSVHSFAPSHPLSASHCIAVRRKEAVPVISGPRLPRWTDCMCDADKARYGRIALVLFKPFRQLSDLIDSSVEEPWLSAYTEWEGSRSIFTRMIMSNMDDFYAARAAEHDSELVDGEENGSSCSASDCSSSDDGYVSEDFNEGHNQETTDPSDWLQHFEDSSRIDQASQNLDRFPSPENYSPQIQHVLREVEEHQLMADMVDEVLRCDQQQGTPSFGLTLEHLKEWVEDSETDSLVRTSGPHDLPQPDDAVRPTTVSEIVDTTLVPVQEIPLQSATALPIQAPLFSGIATISKLFTLNRLQHGAFAIAATHLLRRFNSEATASDATIMSDQELDNRQLRMFLGGEGGTGKSRVIQAIQELCRCWQRPNAVIVTAMTGKAASIINGRTLASLEIALKSPNSHSPFREVDCIIVDEVSMMPKEQLLRLDRLLRRAKRIDRVAFGGVHIILVGDFLQLPPVGADALFVDPVQKRSASLHDFEGFHLWRRFDKIVVLRESVRFKDDFEWGEGCAKARLGEWTSSFVDMINSRMVQQADEHASESLAVEDLLPRQTVFVTPDNETRCAINGHYIAGVAKRLPPGTYPIRVIANFKGALNNLSIADISYIFGLPDNKFGRMAPFLDLVPGMPVQVTQNIRTKKGVANGTTGILHSVYFPQDTVFRQVLDKRSGTVVHLPDKRPLYALLSLDRGPNGVPIAPGLDPRLFPVFPDEQAYSKSVINLTPSSTGEPRSLSIKIQQFPFVCAVGATVYKVQGESLRSMVVVDWKAAVRGANKPQQAYLMVSRVVTRHALVCLKPFTPDLAAWSKPPSSAILEDERLSQESTRTLEAFYESQERQNMNMFDRQNQ